LTAILLLCASKSFAAVALLAVVTAFLYGHCVHEEKPVEEKDKNSVWVSLALKDIKDAQEMHYAAKKTYSRSYSTLWNDYGMARFSRFVYGGVVLRSESEGSTSRPCFMTWIASSDEPRRRYLFDSCVGAYSVLR
jgi:hypothetical protein